MFVFRTHRCTSRSFTYFSLSLADDRKILKKISVDLFFDLVPTRLIYLRKFLLEINELKWCHFLSPIFLSFGPPYYLLGDKQGKKNGTRTSKPLPGFKKQRNFFEQDRRLPSATELNSVTDDAERRTRIAVCQTASVEATGVEVERPARKSARHRPGPFCIGGCVRDSQAKDQFMCASVYELDLNRNGRFLFQKWRHSKPEFTTTTGIHWVELVSRTRDVRQDTQPCSCFNAGCSFFLLYFNRISTFELWHRSRRAPP